MLVIVSRSKYPVIRSVVCRLPMSWYGPRPPMGVPGPPMGFSMGMGMNNGRPPMAVGMQMGGPRQGGPGQPFQAHYSRPPRRDIPTGPPVTVFVGNITEKHLDGRL